MLFAGWKDSYVNVDSPTSRTEVIANHRSKRWNGSRDASSSETEAISHAQLIEGGTLAELPAVVEDSDAEAPVVEIEPTHTAAPELAHPGESQ